MHANFILPSGRDLLNGLFHLLYPDLCVACQKDLPLQGSCFCLHCRLKNVPFPLHSPADNAISSRLWGRLPIQWGAAAYYFNRKSPIQRALHQLKYHNQPDIGLLLGRELGARLVANTGHTGAELIVPVPLHPKKERLRGYNQSAMFAQGLAETMDIPWLTGALKRQTFTGSQTNKKRMERFANMGDVFIVAKPKLLAGKHLLLVDDVLTTGATLEMCGLALLHVPETRLSLATIAVAER